MYKLLYTQPAKIDLKRLDKPIAKRIHKKLLFYSNQYNIFSFAKPLENYIPRVKCYRFRIGDYRAIFTIEPDGCIQILMILGVKHRKDVYLR
jgi:mRNA-degrading endonuclease RelE of RelBE toxin-antitoxin system